MKKCRNKIRIGAAVILVLAAAFWWGGNAPGLHGWKVQNPEVKSVSAVQNPKENQAPVVSEKEPESKELETAKKSEETRQEQAKQVDEPVKPPEKQQEPIVVPAEKPEQPKKDGVYSCTISVSCAEICAHMDWLKKEKHKLIPPNGVILPETKAEFYEGESVFHVLQRELKKAKIHLEFSTTPMYSSAYIEGIHNLYEFDCGERSGWLYSVNGHFPNYGSSRYTLKDGDKIEWVYTCDLGRDVGGYYASGDKE